MVMIKELFSSGRFQQWTTVDTEGMVMVTASVIQDSDRLSTTSAVSAIGWKWSGLNLDLTKSHNLFQPLNTNQY